MRLAILLIGILVSGIFGIQSIVLSGLSDVGTSLGAAEAEEVAGAAAAGIFSAFLGFVGSAFAIGVPVVSAIGFSLAAGLGFTASPEYPDAGIWAWLYLALAGLSIGSVIATRRKHRQANAT